MMSNVVAVCEYCGARFVVPAYKLNERIDPRNLWAGIDSRGAVYALSHYKPNGEPCMRNAAVIREELESPE